MAQLRKCRWCGKPVSPNASSCPSCKRGLGDWPISNIAASCKTCQKPIFLHRAWSRIVHETTGTYVTVSGPIATVGHNGGGVSVVARKCPHCGEPTPLRHGTRSVLRSLPFWLCVLWTFFVALYLQATVIAAQRHLPIDRREAAWMLISFYLVPIVVFILVKIRHHVTRQRVFRRARALDPQPLVIKGYQVFAVCLLIRRRIRKNLALTVSVPAWEATR